MIRTLAITVSPKNRVDKYNTLKWIYQNDAAEIALLFRKCSKNYQIYPEFDITGRLHYHGIAHIHDFIKWFKHTKPGIDKIGYCMIKEIKHDKYYEKNKEKWMDYCLKDWSITKKVLSIEHEIQWTKRTIKKHELRDENNKFIGYGFGYEKDNELIFVDSEDSSSLEESSLFQETTSHLSQSEIDNISDMLIDIMK